MNRSSALRHAQGALLAVLAFAVAGLSHAQELGRAEQLVREGKYREAYELLAPSDGTRKGDATFDYMAAARLALGRAYFALGRYGEAKIQFETVLRVADLPPDLLTQVETYDRMARQYLSEAKRLTSFGYGELGIGYYRVNSTPDTSGGERHNTFYNARVGGGLDY